MFCNVVDAYTYKNYTDAITWPFIRLNNACQCLDARIKHLFSIKIPLVNMEHRHWCASVHTPCDAKQLMVFDVRCICLAIEFWKIFLFKGMCPKIPLCVICVHSYTNILWILYSYTTLSKFGEKNRHLCILDEGIIRHLPRKCFTYGDATLGC